MGGLYKLFLKITPIMMLICFICFGITHAFQQENQPNITYLTHEVIAVNDNNTPNDTTDDITIDNYTFDFENYRQNININILKRAIQNTIDIDTYTNVLNTFNRIWEDGYNFGDGIQTIINALILAINTLIIPINIVITPIRVIAGLILTGMSIVGINITRSTPIITALNGILDYAAIPLINPTYNQDYSATFYGSTWNLHNNINPVERSTNNVDYYLDKTINFTSEGGGNYIRIRVVWHGSGANAYWNLVYTDTGNAEVNVYDSRTGWIYQNSKHITISTGQQLSNDDETELIQWLLINADRQE